MNSARAVRRVVWLSPIRDKEQTRKQGCSSTPTSVVEKGRLGSSLLRCACRLLADTVAKVRKSPDDNFPAKRRSDHRPPISAASNALPRSPVSLSSGDEVPHVFT